MFHRLDPIFAVFRPCFSRKAAFAWFVIVIVGFYVRADHEGVTSFIRWMSLKPSCYESLLHFFYAASWSVSTLLPVWATWVMSASPVRRFRGRPLLIGDGLKMAKDARKMPGVKAHHQESANNSKKASIFGHYWGVIGVLTGAKGKTFCTPVRAEIQDGVPALRPSTGLKGQSPTTVTRRAQLLLAAAGAIGCPCYGVVDAYFAVGPMFLLLRDRLTEEGTQLVHLITRAKDSYVGYFLPESGAKRFQQQDKVKLLEVFDHPTGFQTATVRLYGDLTTISYCTLDLLWQPIDGLVRFVLIQHGGQRFILMCSDLTLDALTILAIYRFRSKIEVMFAVLKNLLGGLSYHFWTRLQPVLSRKKGWTPDFSTLTESARAQVLATLNATERFVNLALIAIGMLQHLSLTIPSQIWQNYSGWLRTYSSELPSERIVKTVIATEFVHPLRKVRQTRTFQAIHAKQNRGPTTHSRLKKEEKS